MKTGFRLLLLSVITITVLSSNFLVLAKQNEVQLTVIELKLDEKGDGVVYAIPPNDDSAKNPDSKLLSYHWHTTAKYYVNPTNKYGYSSTAVVGVIIASANEWDDETTYPVFSYMDTTTRLAGKYDGYNVVSWGKYRRGVIGVTYLWSIGGNVVETDTMLNTVYGWSFSGESSKMDVQNIMTHEFGHWCGLADLYNDRDYWLTMYGYSGYGVTYQRTLGLGDVNGLWSVYGK